MGVWRHLLILGFNRLWPGHCILRNAVLSLSWPVLTKDMFVPGDWLVEMAYSFQTAIITYKDISNTSRPSGPNILAPGSIHRVQIQDGATGQEPRYSPLREVWPQMSLEAA